MCLSKLSYWLLKIYLENYDFIERLIVSVFRGPGRFLNRLVVLYIFPVLEYFRFSF